MVAGGATTADQVGVEPVGGGDILQVGVHTPLETMLTSNQRKNKEKKNLKKKNLKNKISKKKSKCHISYFF